MGELHVTSSKALTASDFGCDNLFYRDLRNKPGSVTKGAVDNQLPISTSSCTSAELREGAIASEIYLNSRVRVGSEYTSRMPGRTPAASSWMYSARRRVPSYIYYSEKCAATRSKRAPIAP
ncbi:hypothetical protein MRX96_025764 [Rhipicephalus microplus]